MGDKHLRLAEKMVYAGILGESLPFGVTHLGYISGSFDADLTKCLESGAVAVRVLLR